MDEQKCPNCGARLPVPKAVRVVHDTVPKALFELLQGKLDELTCEICGKPSGIAPAVLLAHEVGIQSSLVVGNVWDSAQLTQSRRDIEALFGRRAEELADYAALRLRATSYVSQYSEHMRQLLSAADTADYLLRHWREFTPAVFSAFMVALSGEAPGIDAALFQQPHQPERSLVELLVDGASAQAQVWKSLCVSWMWAGAGPRGQTFEEDLHRYIDSSFLIKGARRVFDQFVEGVQKPNLPGQASYILEAARASLYAIGTEENPAAAEWAEIFFDFEVWLHEHDDDPQGSRRLTISDDRARKTVAYRPAYDAVTRRLQQAFDQSDRQLRDRLAEIEQVRPIAARAGFPQLVEQVVELSVRLEDAGDTPVADLAKTWREVADSLPPEVARSFLPDLAARMLVNEGRIDDLETLADFVFQRAGEDRVAQVQIEAWLAEYLNRAREPRRILDRIGTQPRIWESDLPPAIVVRLWGERSTALRLSGQPQRALEVGQATLARAGDRNSEIQRGLRRNIAILQRETGAPDVALDELKELLLEVPQGNEEHFYLLESLATTYCELRLFDDALAATERALMLATGPLAAHEPRLRTIRVQLLAALGRRAEAVDGLSTVSGSADPREALGEAAAWISLGIDDPGLLANNQLSRVVETLQDTLARAQAAGDAQIYLDALYLCAVLVEQGGGDNAVNIWLTLYAAHQERDLPQRPETLLWLAQHAYGRGEQEIGHKYLTQVPVSLSARLGGVQDLVMALDSPRRLAHALDQLKQTVLFDPAARATFRDVRLLAELSRDIVGRARIGLGPTGEPILSRAGLADDVLRRLAPPRGRLGVVEWIHTGEFEGRFITVIHSDGSSASHWLELPDVDEEVLLPRLRTRLRDWRPSKAGDPFDLSDWQQLVDWLHTQLAPHLEEGDHVVFIEAANTAGLPWHVAAAPWWTASYSASWSSLLTLAQRTPAMARALGAFAVPLFNDDDSVKAAFVASVQRTGVLAQELGCIFRSIENSSADREAFVGILAAVDILKVMCHGFYESGEVSLVTAADGALPPGNRLALAGRRGRPYRVSWRELQGLLKAPDVVFSAACSSGLATVAGSGERLGFFNALLPLGTRALVAPWWNIVGHVVLPIVDDVCARYARGEGTLAAVLRGACSAAAETQPRWLAWSLSIEGDWR